MIRPFSNVNVKLSIILPANTNGFVLETWPFTPVLSGIVNTSSVGILAINGTFFSFKLPAPAHTCFSGSSIVKSVPGPV